MIKAQRVLHEGWSHAVAAEGFAVIVRTRGPRHRRGLPGLQNRGVIVKCTRLFRF